MIEIIVSARARQDFKRIWRYIALDNEAAADKLLLAIDAKIEQLRSFPEIGPIRAEIRPGARCLIHGSYIILYDYSAESQTVEIVAIVEGMRDMGGLF